MLQESKFEALGGIMSERVDGRASKIVLTSPLTRCAVKESYTDANLDGDFEERAVLAWQGWKEWSVQTRHNVLDGGHRMDIVSGELPQAHALWLDFPVEGNPVLTVSSVARNTDGARYVYKDLDADGHFDVQTVRAPDGGRSEFILLAQRWTPVNALKDREAFVPGNAEHGARWYRFESEWRLEHEGYEDNLPAASPEAQ